MCISVDKGNLDISHCLIGGSKKRKRKTEVFWGVVAKSKTERERAKETRAVKEA